MSRAVKGAYYLKKPHDQKFYEVLLMWISLMGLGYAKRSVNKVTNWIINLLNLVGFPITASVIFSQLLYMITHRHELNSQSVGVIMAVLPVSCIILTNYITVRLSSYKKLMKEFLVNIHMYNYRHEQVNTEAKLIKIERITRYTSYFLIGCIMVDWMCWTFIPILNNIHKIDKIKNKTSTLDAFIYVWTPFDYSYNVKNWIFIHSVDSFLGCIGCCVVSLLNSMVYIFVYHLIGHIQALNDKLKYNFKDVSNEKEVSEKLKEIIKYHVFIKNMFADIKNAFGLNVTATYLHNLIGDSILLYEVMFGEKAFLVTHGLMFVLYMGGLILLSFVLEEIKNQSDILSKTAYNIPWEDMTVRNQKTFLILFHNIQSPMEFIGAGGLRAGVNPMISIIKSTFSYYVMLKSSM